ncbi:MAG: hypothetical protein P8N23_07335 [Methylophilaceae bacterium]|jgi:chromosome segregation ATPase|nr:hypothetical protein [Methylophilaceae bacterium]
MCLFTSLLFGVKHANAQDKMLWEMRPNESLVELAAKFYPKSAAMQRVFIAKTQQLNQDTQLYANSNQRYTTSTKIVIPTLKSLSVRGAGAKKFKRSKKKTSEKISQEAQHLEEQKSALDTELAKHNEKIKALEDKANQLKQQLDQSKNTPAESKSE